MLAAGLLAPVPAAMLVVGCGTAEVEGLGAVVVGLLARAVVSALLPQFFQLNQLLLVEGQPQAPLRQPVAQHRLQRARATTNPEREMGKRMIVILDRQ